MRWIVLLSIQITPWPKTRLRVENSDFWKFNEILEVFLKKVFANYIAAKMLENKPSGYEKTGILFIVK